MKIHYYPETDSLYIDLADSVSVDSQEVRPGVVLDFDANGRLVGIDLDQASQHTDLTHLDLTDIPARITAQKTEAA